MSRSVYRNTDKEALEIGRTFDAELAGKDRKVVLHELLGFKKMDLQLELQSSLHLLLKDEDKFSALFYEKVFEKAPFVRKLFTKSMYDQGRLLTHMLGGIVYSLARPEYLTLGLKRLGQNHQRYGVEDAYYPVVKEAMLETIPEILGEFYRPEINEAWSQALDFVVETMISGKAA